MDPGSSADTSYVRFTRFLRAPTRILRVMNSIRRMNWTCPRCLTRNTRTIPENTEHGRLLAVRCENCRTEHLLTAIVRPQPGGETAIYGIAWV